MAVDSFGARDRISVGDTSYVIFRLDRVDGATRLPYGLKVLLENLLRNEDGRLVTAGQVSALAGWDPVADHASEVCSSARYGCGCRTSPGCRAWSIRSRCVTR